MNRSRKLALESSYDESLDLLGELILQNPTKPDPLLLKGNILAMMSSDGRLSAKRRHALDLKREKCIRRALELQPTCVTALIDMADLLQERTNHPREKSFGLAQEYYDRAHTLLKAGKPWGSLKEELEELQMGKRIFMAKFNLSRWHNKSLKRDAAKGRRAP